MHAVDRGFLSLLPLRALNLQGKEQTKISPLLVASGRAGLTSQRAICPRDESGRKSRRLSLQKTKVGDLPKLRREGTTPTSRTKTVQSAGVPF